MDYENYVKVDLWLNTAQTLPAGKSYRESRNTELFTDPFIGKSWLVKL